MSMLQEVFTAVLNMSITASCVVVGVLLVRLILRKAPRVFLYVLWSAVFFRLVCPVSIASDFSFFNLLDLDTAQSTGITEYVSYDTGGILTPADISTDSIGSKADDSQTLQFEQGSDVISRQTVFGAASVVWLAGMIILLLYSMISYSRVKKRLRTATLVKDNIFETDTIDTAFICGFIKPKIYVPVGVGNVDMTYILAHEQVHIKRFDHVIKPFAFLVLVVHWFNPLVWVSFALLNRDIEMSCDESVIREMGMAAKTGYSNSLLSLAAKRNVPAIGSPLAFGESDVKDRIKNVLNYRKPSFWVLAAAALVCCAAVVGLASDPGVSLEPEKLETEVEIRSDEGEKSPDIASLVEENLAVIMSSPMESSNSQDYIDAHRDEYETIIKLGGEEALQYMLGQFEQGDERGLRGHIMMSLCKEILGIRNNVEDESLSPEEWYSALSIRQEVELPDFVYSGTDALEKLVYATEVEKYSNPQRGFIVVASKIFGSYEEGDRFKVFVTTYSAGYKLYDNVLSMEWGSVVPAAITYVKSDNGSYVLQEYEQARDGAYFGESIREYCTMPVSGKKIAGLADQILDHYGDYEDIRTLHRENLGQHLKAHEQTDVKLYLPSGEILILP